MLDGTTIIAAGSGQGGLIFLAIFVIITIVQMVKASKQSSGNGKQTEDAGPGEPLSPDDELRDFLQGLSKPQPQPPSPPPVQQHSHAGAYTQSEVNQATRNRATIARKQIQPVHEPIMPPPLAIVEQAAPAPADAYEVSVAASSPTVVAQITKEKKLSPVIASALSDRTSLRNAFILKEILSTPLGLRSPADLMQIPRP